jgi:hypothetical protein
MGASCAEFNRHPAISLTALIYTDAKAFFGPAIEISQRGEMNDGNSLLNAGKDEVE